MLIISWLVSLGLACNFLALEPLTPVPVATSTPTASATPTETPVPLSKQVSLASLHAEESGESPNYTISSETPAILDSEDPRVQAFNALASGLVEQDINEFKASLKYVPGTPIAAGSFLEIRWERVSPPGDVISLKFNVIGYADGAAHPYHYSQTLNFDLERGEQISLDQLFLPGTDYLQLIAEYCKAELSSRDIAFDQFSSGADPTQENYRSWNITREGLLITFDEYQVAAYAAGPQVVTVPYLNLSAIIDPQGPLAKFLP
jgi:hypothetical protein